jgi:hypothetical protein
MGTAEHDERSALPWNYYKILGNDGYKCTFCRNGVNQAEKVSYRVEIDGFLLALAAVSQMGRWMKRLTSLP